VLGAVAGANRRIRGVDGRLVSSRSPASATASATESRAPGPRYLHRTWAGLDDPGGKYALWLHWGEVDAIIL